MKDDIKLELDRHIRNNITEQELFDILDYLFYIAKKDLASDIKFFQHYGGAVSYFTINTSDFVCELLVSNNMRCTVVNNLNSYNTVSYIFRTPNDTEDYHSITAVKNYFSNLSEEDKCWLILKGVEDFWS